MMQRIVALAAFLALLAASIGSADLVQPRPSERKPELIAGMTRSYLEPFKQGQSALAIASGNGRSRLAMYVFDVHGNCLGKDDHSAPATGDDLIVAWYPAADGLYSIDLHNEGLEKNAYQIAVR